VSSLFKDISEIVSGKRSHFNNVCVREWNKVYENFQKNSWPYSVVTKHLLALVLTSFENDFCRGGFSHSLRKVDRKLARKVIAIYLSYAIHLFSKTQFCKDVSGLYSNFNVEILWDKVCSKASECKAIRLRIKQSKNSGGRPIAGLYNSISEVVGKISGEKWKGSGADLLSRPIIYMQNLGLALDNLRRELVKKNGVHFG